MRDLFYMKKALLLVCILTISVITTACINNFAIQELNSKAMTYMEQGNYAEAIERLKSSVDLDGSVFESHYNLAVAYTKAEDYINAMKSYQKAISLNPDYAECYYSLAVAEENLASDLESGILFLDENGELKQTQEDNLYDDDDRSKDAKLTDAEKTYINDLRADAIKNYKEYLNKGKDIEDSVEVNEEINKLQDKIGLTETKE